MTMRHLLVGSIALAALVTAWGCQPKQEAAPPQNQTVAGISFTQIATFDAGCIVYRGRDTDGTVLYVTLGHCSVATKSP
jgi:hypothetical protein